MIHLFGYGSLIWRPGFCYEKRRPAELRGWQRRFWQQSTDHRGTPDAPGRVVTLIEAPEMVCCGVLYTIAQHEGEQVLSYLDHREKGGYERVITTAYLADGTPMPNTIVYHGSTNNPEFIGPEDPEHTASIIRTSHGPSGPNRDYLYKLANALDELNERDPHIEQLLKLVGPTPC